MAPRTRKIDNLIAVLEKSGADPLRLDVLRRTQRFKRSWVDLAEGLVEVRRTGAFRSWGYEDLYTYCRDELSLRKATVDKLTASYHCLRTHAPQVLARDGLAREVPSYEAVEYFDRATRAANEPAAPGPRAPAPPPKEVLDELRRAVFDEGRPVSELRKRFDPVLHPKTEPQRRLAALESALRLSRKLAQLLPDIEGLSADRVEQVELALGALRSDLETLAEPMRAMVRAARKQGRSTAQG